MIKSVNFGVPQDSILGKIMFFNYINDIVNIDLINATANLLCGSISQRTSVKFGVPQGSVLEPVMIITYINDIINIIVKYTTSNLYEVLHVKENQ